MILENSVSSIAQRTRRREKSVLTFAAFWLVVAALLTACDKAPPSPRESSPVASATNVTATPAVKPQFAKLVGKWQRPDGGYVIEIKSVDPVGKLEAAYFNPNPINVSRAAAYQKEGSVKVFVELRDVNYPGSTYDLAYDPQSDQLFGQYFQAALGQTFDVTFARLKEQ